MLVAVHGESAPPRIPLSQNFPEFTPSVLSRLPAALLYCPLFRSLLRCSRPEGLCRDVPLGVSSVRLSQLDNSTNEND